MGTHMGEMCKREEMGRYDVAGSSNKGTRGGRGGREMGKNWMKQEVLGEGMEREEG